MLKLILIALAGISAANAAPFIVSDPAPSGTVPTHCGVYLDGAARTDVAVTSDATGKYCKIDAAGVTVGAHTVALSFVINDAVWGNLEGPKSSPFPFSRPSAPTVAPGGTSLSK